MLFLSRDSVAARIVRLRKAPLAIGLGAGSLVAAFVAPAAHAAQVPAAQPAAPPSGVCTMIGIGEFNTADGHQIHKEDSLSTDTTQSQHLVVRSVTGPSHLFRLNTLTSGSCHDNPSFPPGDSSGTPVNVFNGLGSGSLDGAPGYTIQLEGTDYGDSSSTDSTPAGDNSTLDHFSFSVRNSSRALVWQGAGNLTSGSEEISEAGSPPPPPGSCEPSSSLALLVSGTNVTSYVPKGSWSTSGTHGVSVVNVEGSSVTPTRIPTTHVANSAASNPNTGVTVATANNTDVYLLQGNTRTATLSSGGSGTIDFSGGSATNTGVAIDATHNRAVIGESVGGLPGFQFLDLNSDTFLPPFTSPSGEISEDPLIDPSRNLLLSASENGNYEIIDVSNPSSPKFYENQTGAGELDSSGEDCQTGIALAGAEFSDPSSVYIADLTQATYTPGSPGAWTAPSQIQTLSESHLAAGPDGVAVAQGTHTGILTGEFGGNSITAISLPATSGSGVPAIQDWLTCSVPNTPNGNAWNQGDDPHTVNAYQSPNGGDAMSVLANEGASWLASVDLTKMLNPSIVARDAAGHACSAGTLPASLVHFVPVP